MIATTMNSDPTEHSEIEREIFEQIGKFVFWFSRVDFLLRSALAEFLELPDELWAKVTFQYEFRMLCAVLSATYEVKCIDEADKREAKKLIDRCYRINDTRNRIVHGTWSVNEDEVKAAHMSRHDLKVTDYFKERDKLIKAADDCFKLAQDLAFFPGTPMARAVAVGRDLIKSHRRTKQLEQRRLPPS